MPKRIMRKNFQILFGITLPLSNSGSRPCGGERNPSGGQAKGEPDGRTQSKTMIKVLFDEEGHVT